MSENQKGWIGVDLDGTLAHYDGWKGIEHIGDPVPVMLARVKRWIAEGKDVRIVTARVVKTRDPFEQNRAGYAVLQWCEKHIGKWLPVTNEKDLGMVELWDDRAIQVITNTGQRVDGNP